MANPLYKAFGNSQYGNMNGLLRQFQQFKNNFKGDPREQIQQMLNSGRISQEDYNKAVQMANTFQRMLKM